MPLSACLFERYEIRYPRYFVMCDSLVCTLRALVWFAIEVRGGELREVLFFIAVTVISITAIFIWIIFFGPMRGQEKTYIQDSTTFAIVVMAMLFAAFVAVTVVVLFL